MYCTHKLISPVIMLVKLAKDPATQNSVIDGNVAVQICFLWTTQWQLIETGRGKKYFLYGYGYWSVSHASVDGPTSLTIYVALIGLSGLYNTCINETDMKLGREQFGKHSGNWTEKMRKWMWSGFIVYTYDNLKELYLKIIKEGVRRINSWNKP